MPLPPAIRTKLVRAATVALVLITAAAALTPPDAAQAGVPLPQQAVDDQPVRTQTPDSAVPGQFIVVAKDGVDLALVRNVVTGLGGTVGISFTNVLNGLVATLPPGVDRLVRASNLVLVVSEDRLVAATATVPTGVDRVGADIGGTRAGVPVAVLDTGIAPHPTLIIAGGYNCTATGGRGDYGDANGHGTHVAGTIGANGQVVGVAPGTPLTAVKVLGDDGFGQWSWIICGLDWAVGQNITVANLSLSGARGTENTANCDGSALHKAVCNAKVKGLSMVVAAGNNGATTDNFVPAAYDEVTTVSALADYDGCSGGRGGSTSLGTDDNRASFSNRGRAVDFAAPGVNILSTAPGGGLRQLSGTSMAAPHVAALVALYGVDGYAKTPSGFAAADGTTEPIAVVPNGSTACPPALVPPPVAPPPAPEPAPAPAVGAPAAAAPVASGPRRDRKRPKKQKQGPKRGGGQNNERPKAGRR